MKIDIAPEKTLLKLDLGCGNNKKEGFFGVDIVKEGTQADVECDLLEFPWPFDAESVGEMFSSHYVEHIPQKLRPLFFEEAYRVLSIGGKFMIVTPFAWSNRAIQDFTHEWPPICPETYLYFNRAWRELNKLNYGHYDLKCDFEIETCNFILNEDSVKKTNEEKSLLVKNNINVVDDMVVVLKKR